MTYKKKFSAASERKIKLATKAQRHEVEKMLLFFLLFLRVFPEGSHKRQAKSMFLRLIFFLNAKLAFYTTANRAESRCWRFSGHLNNLKGFAKP
jgi:hypothetical protein